MGLAVAAGLTGGGGDGQEPAKSRATSAGFMSPIIRAINLKASESEVLEVDIGLDVHRQHNRMVGVNKGT